MGLSKALVVDLAGRLSNPPDALVSALQQGLRQSPLRERATPIIHLGDSTDSESCVLNIPGRLSNLVQRRLPHSEVERLVRTYVDGRSIDDLARNFGVHRTTVIRHLDESGISRRKVVRRMNDDLVAQAKTRYESGVSLARVAREFSVSPGTLRREFMKIEIAIRARWT